MPAPFALPLAASSTTQNAQISSTPSSRARFLPKPARKRKRALRHDNSSAEEIIISSNSEDDLATFTNPLSLTQDEIVQRRLAGLGLSEPSPSDNIRDFPHRSLPAPKSILQPKKNKGKIRAGGASNTGDDTVNGSGNEIDEENIQSSTIKRPNLGPKLRLQHFSVLNTILHRCLNEGDLERASRAWAMLIRMQISGEAIDLKMSGYWGIGAELLVRSLDGKKRRSIQDAEVAPDHELESTGNENVNCKGRWGTKEGLEKAKDYYERLILQFPYRRHHENSISALDFWPAMVGCEIYGIETERKEELAKLQKEEEKDEGDTNSGSESDPEPEPELDEDQGFGTSVDERLQDQRVRRRAERRWIARDDVRRAAQTATQQLALTLDELMATPHYSDSHNMLRLRANIAVYLGDLSVPVESTGDEEAKGNTDRRQLLRQRRRDRESGLKKQKEEHRRARALFDRVLIEKGDLDGGLGIKDFETEDQGDEQMEINITG